MDVEVSGKERGKGRRRGEEGQSILEFLLMLPMMVGLVVILVKVNTTIQMSINNQQYARAQTLFMAYNSPVYPSLVQRESNLIPKKYNQMVVGVSENSTDVAGNDILPKAATNYIARKKGAPDSEEKNPPGGRRALVRVRDTVTLCTQSSLVTSGGNLVPVLKLAPVGADDFRADGPFNLGEGGSSSAFSYCASPKDAYKDDDSGGDS